MTILHTFLMQNQNWLDGILWAVLSILLFFGLVLLLNLFTYPRLRPASELPGHVRKQRYPLVSILLPARNEAHCIEACIRSLVAQDYGPLEVLVLDDQSSDGTGAIVQHIIDELPARQYARLQLLQGKELPAGWIGKNFACQQLAEYAHGDLLYFTDADTVHEPGTVRAVVSCMQRYQVQLLSAHPEYVFGSLGERLLVPLLPMLMLVLLPLALVPRSRQPMLSNGNGQLMCLERVTYELIGGHRRVRESLIEDIVLARLCKAAGRRMIFVDASELVHCRMYRSFADVVAGFSKSQFATFRFACPFALIGIMLLLTLFVVPPVIAVLALLGSMPLLAGLALTVFLLAVSMRMLMTVRCTHQQRMFMILLCFLHPVAILLECLILLNAIRWYYRKAGVIWKGRYYKEQ